MRRCLALCLLGAAVLPAAPSRASAAPLSVLDPKLTFDWHDLPLSQALEDLSRRSGVAISSATSNVRLVGLPEEHRRRLDPPVTLSAKDEPLRGVLRRLADSGMTVQMMGDRVQILGLPGAKAGEPKPVAKVGGYRVQISALTIEDTRYLRFGQPSAANRRTRVDLAMDCESELANRALLGAGLDSALRLDGEDLTPQSVRPESGWLPLGSSGLTSTIGLTFSLPSKAPTTIDSLTGSLRVYPDAKEVALEFGDLDRGNQQQTEGDIDVTLVRYGQAGGFAPVGQPTPVEAQITLSYPKTDTNLEQLRRQRTFGVGMPVTTWQAPVTLQIGGALRDGPAGVMAAPPPPPVPALEPVRRDLAWGAEGAAPVAPPPPPPPAQPGQPRVDVRQETQVQRQANVMIMRDGVVQRFEMGPDGQMRQVEGPPAAVMPQAPAVMPPAAPPVDLGGIQRGPGNFVAPGGLVMPGPMGVPFAPGMVNGLTPMVVLETEKGRYPLAVRQQMQPNEGNGDRITLTCTAVGPAPAEPVQRVLVGLVDYGQRTANLAYAFTGVALPAVP